MNEKTDKLSEIIRETIVEYHLSANKAINQEIPHYPSIVEAQNQILQACKDAGLKFVPQCLNNDQWLVSYSSGARPHVEEIEL